MRRRRPSSTPTLRDSPARVIYACPLPDAATRGHFVAPTLVRLHRIEDLDRETFGPILHVVTWKSGALEATARRVMALRLRS